MFKKNVNWRGCILLCLIFASTLCQAQSDTLRPKPQPQGEVENITLIKHSPRKAATMSAILPGLGQAYNKKYWKIPIIYAGFAGLGVVLSSTQKKYKTYRTAYIYRVDGDATTVDSFVGIYSDDQLSTLQEYYHRYRDLYAIGIGLLYVLNIVDAAVDGHLYSFDVSNNLSLRVVPMIETTAYTKQLQKGFTLTLKF